MTYSTYEARGNGGPVVDGPNDLTLHYEPVLRLTEVRESRTPQRTLKAFTCCALNGAIPGGGSDSCNDKLENATHNSSRLGPAQEPAITGPAHRTLLDTRAGLGKRRPPPWGLRISIG